MNIDTNTILTAFVMIFACGMLLAAALFMTRDPEKRFFKKH